MLPVTKFVLAGVVSEMTTPVALALPLLLTTMVYVMVSPSDRSPVADELLLTCRTGVPVTVTGTTLVRVGTGVLSLYITTVLL